MASSRLRRLAVDNVKPQKVKTAPAITTGPGGDPENASQRVSGNGPEDEVKDDLHVERRDRR